MKDQLESSFKRIPLSPDDQGQSVFLRADNEFLPELAPKIEWRWGEPDWDSREPTFTINWLISGWRSIVLQVLVVVTLVSAWWQWIGLGREIFLESRAENGLVTETLSTVASQPLELPPLDHAMAREAIDAYLRADSIDGLLPWVRHSISVAPLMEAYYQKHEFAPDILASVDLVALQHRQDMLYYMVRVERQREGRDHFVLFQTSKGMKIDWQSHVGFNTVTWSEMMKNKSTERTALRTHATPANYFNYHYDNDRRDLCVELREPQRQWNSLWLCGPWLCPGKRAHSGTSVGKSNASDSRSRL